MKANTSLSRTLSDIFISGIFSLVLIKHRKKDAGVEILKHN